MFKHIYLYTLDIIIAKLYYYIGYLCWLKNTIKFLDVKGAIVMYSDWDDDYEEQGYEVVPGVGYLPGSGCGGRILGALLFIIAIIRGIIETVLNDFINFVKIVGPYFLGAGVVISLACIFYYSLKNKTLKMIVSFIIFLVLLILLTLIT